MKKTILASAVPLLLLFAAQAQVKMPAPSPVQTLKQDLGMGSITLTYSRPGAKGRKVLGDLVPLAKLWRMGANAATTIHFTDPVEIGGKKMDTGTYALYAIPREENWEIILNRGINNWGIDGYKETDDVARFKVPHTKTNYFTETFTLQFANIKAESCDIQLLWEKTSVLIPIITDIKEKLKMQVEAGLASDKKPYWEAAQFYYEYEKNLPKALDNVNKALESNDKAFWMFLYKAGIQKDMGDIAGAIETSKISLALSKEAGNEDYVKMNQQLQKELKRLLEN